jgi:hypothetical protein
MTNKANVLLLYLMCIAVYVYNRENASAAIDGLHERYTLEGGPRPLVVKFADNNKRGVVTRVSHSLLTSLKLTTLTILVLSSRCTACMSTSISIASFPLLVVVRLKRCIVRLVLQNWHCSFVQAYSIMCWKYKHCLNDAFTCSS